jgi:uncharacterized membrane protein
MMYGYDMTSTGWVWMVGAWAVLELAIVGGAWLIADAVQTNRPIARMPLDILGERFARGEISRDAYEAARRALQ